MTDPNPFPLRFAVAIAVFLFYLTVFLLFVSVGFDRGELIGVRFSLIGLILFLSFCVGPKHFFKGLGRSPTLMVFGLFLIFLLLRSFLKYGQAEMPLLGAGAQIPDTGSVSGMTQRWFFFFALVWSSSVFLRTRERTKGFIRFVGAVVSGIALTALVPFLLNGQYGYIHQGKFVFFPPFLYFHPDVAKYFLGTFAHFNYIGDLLAMGFFPALGLVTYAIVTHLKNIEYPGNRRRFPWFEATLILIAAVVCAVTIFLFFSRGCIVSFLVSFLLYWLIFLWKIHQRRVTVFVLIVSTLLALSVFFVGNFQKAWQEVKTLQSEVESPSSFRNNLEGGKAALAMYHDHRVWGIGTGNYRARVMEYSETIRTEPGLTLARFVVLCHYLQVLAEEGAGAWIYFAMLGVFLFEVIRGFIRAKSNFQFIAGLSVFIPVVMTLGHATINFVMQQVSMSLLVYLFMGATLGILHADFLYHERRTDHVKR
ncbi:MAG: O-antigen ligase family protein [Candidatus Omnitrophota bacterium]